MSDMWPGPPHDAYPRAFGPFVDEHQECERCHKPVDWREGADQHATATLLGTDFRPMHWECALDLMVDRSDGALIRRNHHQFPSIGGKPGTRWWCPSCGQGYQLSRKQEWNPLRWWHR